MSEPTERTALQDAVRWLKQADRTEAELRERLAQRGHEASAIETAIARLREVGYVNDDRLAGRIAESAASERLEGREKIRWRLEGRGLDDGLVESHVTHLDEGSEVDRAKQAVQRRFRNEVDAARMARFLATRGFDEDVIRTVLASYFPDWE